MHAVALELARSHGVAFARAFFEEHYATIRRTKLQRDSRVHKLPPSGQGSPR